MGSYSRKLLLASAFARCLRLLHPFRHFRFHGVQVKTGPLLHRREIKERLEFLSHYLLDEHETPELELEPIEVLLRSFFCSIVRPALTLEWIQAQIDQVRYINMGF